MFVFSQLLSDSFIVNMFGSYYIVKTKHPRKRQTMRPEKITLRCPAFIGFGTHGLPFTLKARGLTLTMFHLYLSLNTA